MEVLRGLGILLGNGNNSIKHTHQFLAMTSLEFMSCANFHQASEAPTNESFKRNYLPWTPRACCGSSCSPRSWAETEHFKIPNAHAKRHNACGYGFHGSKIRPGNLLVVDDLFPR